MAKNLVIVESQTKAKTIGKYLGKQFLVKASIGHVKDLPKKNLSVDVDNDFKPVYEVIEGKKKLMAELKSARQEPPKTYTWPLTLTGKAKPSVSICRKNSATGKTDRNFTG